MSNLMAVLLQGLASSAIAVASQALVRDLFRGMRAAELLSRLALITGMAPILAPLVGSGLLTVTSWRGVFVVLATAAVLIGLLVRQQLPETLPAERRIPATVGGTVAAYRQVLAVMANMLPVGRIAWMPDFLAVVLVASMGFTALFAYVSGSPFVMQGVFGLSPQVFGVVFASMSLGLSLCSQLNPRLVRAVGPVRALTAGLVVITASAAVMLLLAQFGVGGLAGFLLPMFGVLNDGTSRPIPLVILAASLVALATMLLAGRRLRAESYD